MNPKPGDGSLSEGSEKYAPEFLRTREIGRARELDCPEGADNGIRRKFHRLLQIPKVLVTADFPGI